MNKYEYLLDRFLEDLGDNFNLVYNNDEKLTWADILLNKEQMVSGVAHTNSGAFEKVNGYSITTQQLSIQFMIPTDTAIFSQAIQQIEDTFKGLHNSVYEFNNEIIKVLFNYLTDTAKVLVNGTDYATCYVYLNLIGIENAVMSNETYVKINGDILKGVFHTSYNNIHNADGIVKANVNLMQLNNVNSIQQTLGIDLVAIKKDNDILLEIINNININKTYDIAYYNGLTTKTFKGYVVALTEEGTFNDTLKLKITFGVANE